MIGGAQPAVEEPSTFMTLVAFVILGLAIYGARCLWRNLRDRSHRGEQ